MTSFIDERGKLIFPIKYNNFQAKESTISINKLHVFRGIHIESFEKLITCVQGTLLDIVINFNKDDEDYLVPKYYNLDGNTENNQILIPANHGHAFLTLSDNTIVLYHYDDIFDPIKTKSVNYRDPLLNVKLPIEAPIISQKDLYAPLYQDMDYYIFGHSGFIGSVIVENLLERNKNIFKTKLRLENVEQIERELDIFKPKHIVCSAGLTGNPNISWCETHKPETIETNITYQMTLVHLAHKKKIHLTLIGSGVIFKSDRFYGEDEPGNYDGNYYGKCRIVLENMVAQYDNVLYVRVNYPISCIPSERNLITKILKYKTIQKNLITLTFIDELIPYMIELAEEYDTGVCNLVNNGAICLTEIARIYSINKEHNYEESDAVDTSKSNSLLSIGKLNKFNVMNTTKAVENCIRKYVSNNNNIL